MLDETSVAEGHSTKLRCRMCQRSEPGPILPNGWYLLKRGHGNSGKPFHLGLYCTLACLDSAQQSLQHGHQRHAERLGLSLNEDDSIKRFLADALTMRNQGMSTAEVADILDVPPKLLKTWMQAFGMAVEPPSSPANGAPSKPQPTIAEFILAKASKQPVMALHELVQARYLTAPQWTEGMSGPPHQPHVTARVTTTRCDYTSNIKICGIGDANSKKAARAAAAADLLTQLCTAEA